MYSLEPWGDKNTHIGIKISDVTFIAFKKNISCVVYSLCFLYAIVWTCNFIVDGDMYVHVVTCMLM